MMRRIPVFITVMLLTPFGASMVVVPPEKMDLQVDWPSTEDLQLFPPRQSIKLIRAIKESKERAQKRTRKQKCLP